MSDYYFPNAGSTYSTLVAQSEYPSKLDTDANLVSAANKASTTLSGNINSSDTTINVVDTSLFSAKGVLVCEDEVMTYTGKTSTSFTGVTRAFEGTTAANHNSGAAIEQQITKSSNNVKNDAIRELQLKVGVESSTPVAGFALIGTGNGSSQWLPAREVLADNRNYYVSASTGSNSNDGRTTSTQFATIQKAVDVASLIDAAGYNITINVANGTYNEYVTLRSVTGVASASALTIIGNTTTPSSVVVQGFQASNLICAWNLRGFKTQNSIPQAHISAVGSVIRLQSWDFGSCVNTSVTPNTKNVHIGSFNGSSVSVQTNYAISGGASAHVNLLGDSFVDLTGRTVTVTNSPDIGTWVIANYLCYAYMHNMSWTAQLTGTRYSISSNSVVFINNSTPNTYFASAGTVNGSTATGGVIF